MSAILKIPFSGDINDLLKKALQESKNFDGIFEGNKEKGSFDFKALGGRFIGNYEVRGMLIEIVLKKKPFFIATSLIENFLKLHIK